MNKGNIRNNCILYVLIGLEILACIFLLVRFNGTSVTTEFSPEFYEVLAGQILENGDYQVDELSGAQRGPVLQTAPMALRKGVYRVHLRFDASAEQVLRVEAPSAGYHALLVNAVSLHDVHRMNENGVTFILQQDVTDLRIVIGYSGTGSLILHEMDLTNTNEEYGMALFWLLIGSLLLNLAVWIVPRWRKGCFTPEQKTVFLVLLAIAVISSYPMFIDYLHMDDDVNFHVTRLEGIVRSWRSGQFPARLHPNWLNGMGYPVSIMYGDLFLWPMALIRLLGFDLMFSYKAGVVLINIATVYVCYFSFKRIFEDYRIGLFGTAIYVFSLYRLYNVYMRGAVGEFTAMMFLPVVACGLYLVFQEEPEKAGDRKNILILTAGFGGLVLSHVLSFEFACIFAALTCLLNWKKTIRPCTILTILKAAGLSIALSLYFLVPFLDYSLHVPMQVFGEFGGEVQSKGLYISQLISLFQWAGRNPYMMYEGMRQVRPFGMGEGMLAAAGLFLYFMLIRGRSLRENWIYRFGRYVFGIGAFTSVMCLSLFPWDAIASSCGIARSVVNSIQFPYRLLVIVTVCFTLAGCALCRLLRETAGRKSYLWAVGIMLTMTAINAFFFMDCDMQFKSISTLRNPEAIGSEMISGMEYLPLSTSKDIAQLAFNTVNHGEAVEVISWEKADFRRSITCENHSGSESYVEPTLLNYLGYRAVDSLTGKELESCEGDNGVMRVLLPGNYKGTVEVRFVGRTYWRIADMISLLTWISMAGLLLFRYLSTPGMRRRHVLGGRNEAPEDETAVEASEDETASEAQN